ncbi:hypothetical protein [Pseudomonas cremoricolorata]|uniref:Uncharacterized protein n=1 Tax=Pseudomonas cremoricolorata TaxID=157783 RepID=A0A089WGS4_9PSED|nr:hypothetical protein [Pseudomonas cremoricolorata]AIR87791.1 hypothetical protein LK03_00420 [Pseudomonas cremoricolorata]
MPDASTGSLIKSYRYGRGYLIFIYGFIAVLLGLAAFLAYGYSIFSTPGATTSGGTRFNGPPEVLLYAAGFLVFIALCMFALSRWQKKLRDARYDVHEHGIRQVTSSVDEFVPFVEMDDLYLFASGQTLTAGLINNLAYRRHAGEQFRRVNPHMPKLDEFMELVRDLHVQARLPIALETLSQGGSVQFNYADTQQVWGKRVTGNFLNVETKPLLITPQTLEVDGRRFPISLLREANVSNWTEKVVIKDNDGQVVLSTIATGIMSMDVFFNVLGWMQEQQQVAVTGKVLAD